MRLMGARAAPSRSSCSKLRHTAAAPLLATRCHIDPPPLPASAVAHESMKPQGHRRVPLAASPPKPGLHLAPVPNAHGPQSADALHGYLGGPPRPNTEGFSWGLLSSASSPSPGLVRKPSRLRPRLRMAVDAQFARPARGVRQGLWSQAHNCRRGLMRPSTLRGDRRPESLGLRSPLIATEAHLHTNPRPVPGLGGTFCNTSAVQALAGHRHAPAAGAGRGRRIGRGGSRRRRRRGRRRRWRGARRHSAAGGDGMPTTGAASAYASIATKDGVAALGPARPGPRQGMPPSSPHSKLWFMQRVY
jgi:hypothetical protein